MIWACVLLPDSEVVTANLKRPGLTPEFCHWPQVKTQACHFISLSFLLGKVEAL